MGISMFESYHCDFFSIPPLTPPAGGRGILRQRRLHQTTGLAHVDFAAMTGF